MKKFFFVFFAFVLGLSAFSLPVFGVKTASASDSIPSYSYNVSLQEDFNTVLNLNRFKSVQGFGNSYFKFTFNFSGLRDFVFRFSANNNTFITQSFYQRIYINCDNNYFPYVVEFSCPEKSIYLASLANNNFGVYLGNSTDVFTVSFYVGYQYLYSVLPSAGSYQYSPLSTTSINSISFIALYGSTYLPFTDFKPDNFNLMSYFINNFNKPTTKSDFYSNGIPFYELFSLFILGDDVTNFFGNKTLSSLNSSFSNPNVLYDGSTYSTFECPCALTSFEGYNSSLIVDYIGYEFNIDSLDIYFNFNEMLTFRTLPVFFNFNYLNNISSVVVSMDCYQGDDMVASVGFNIDNFLLDNISIIDISSIKDSFIYSYQYGGANFNFRDITYSGKSIDICGLGFDISLDTLNDPFVIGDGWSIEGFTKPELPKVSLRDPTSWIVWAVYWFFFYCPIVSDVVNVFFWFVSVLITLFNFVLALPMGSFLLALLGIAVSFAITKAVIPFLQRATVSIRNNINLKREQRNFKRLQRKQKE